MPIVFKWKWQVSQRIDDTASDTAFWLCHDNYDRHVWLRLLGHNSSAIVHQTIKTVIENNDVDAVPKLIGLLNRHDIHGGEVS